MPFHRADELASVDAEPLDEAALPPLSEEASAQVRSLETVRVSLQAEAKAYALQLAELAALGWRAQQAGGGARRSLPMELAGSWQISQWTAERWLSEAEWFTGAVPLTLAMLGEGRLLKHQAVAVRQELETCTAEIAGKVETEVLPAGAGLCPTDLRRELKRVRLRLERERLTAEQAQAREREKVGRRRTWTRPTEDGSALAGAVTTPEQNVAWAQGMDALERRERLADRAAGIDRTAEQRRADLFASLPAIVLAGLAADDRWRRQAGIGGGRPPLTAPAGGTLLDTAGPIPPAWALTPEQIAAQITLNVHVPVSTILDLSHEPGTLDRYGPLGAEHIRLVRPKSYRRILADAGRGRPIALDDHLTPAAGTEQERREQIRAMLTPDVVIDTDEPQHDPSARLARLIDTRDVRCAGPGCTSGRHERDHLQPYSQGGKTNAGNLGLVSPRCHHAKHDGWRLQRLPDGSSVWHSPLRQTYRRPGPWPPPPKVDLYTPPPRPPTPSATPPTETDDDIPLSDRIRHPDPPKPPAPENTRHGWNDDPPF